MQPVPVSAAARWRQARVVVQHEVLVSRWHKDVDHIHKRLWLSFKSSHTLMAGVVYKGYAGHTRAETIMILMNSLALEIVVLCMFYSLPSASPPPSTPSRSSSTALSARSSASRRCSSLRGFSSRKRL